MRTPTLILLLSVMLASCAVRPLDCRPTADVKTRPTHPGDTRSLAWLAEVWVGVSCPFSS